MRVTVTEIRHKYRPKCTKACPAKADCPLSQLRNRLKSDMRDLIRVSVIIENSTDSPVSPTPEGWELVDAQGFSVGGAAVCEGLLPADHVPIDRWEITPHTCVRTMLAFPQGEAPPMMLLYGDDQYRLRSEILLKLQQSVRRERISGKAKLRIQGRGQIAIEECWSFREADGRKKYIFAGIKK